MKMNKLITTALLALASAALLGTSASAQQFSNGDLMLDFRVNTGTGTGGTQNLEVDLGKTSGIGAFNFAVSNNDVITLTNDLNTIYGSPTAANLVFSLAAAGGTSFEYISNPGNSATLNPTSLQGNEGQISALYGTPSSETAGQATGAYNVAVGTPSVSDPEAYSDVLTNVNGDHGNQGNVFPENYNFVPFSTEAADGSSIDLYEIYDTGANTRTSPLVAHDTDLGTFTLSSTGVLSYASASVLPPPVVPEPSTYALFGLGAAVMLFLRRRMVKA
jgi:hypothetical protein